MVDFTVKSDGDHLWDIVGLKVSRDEGPVYRAEAVWEFAVGVVAAGGGIGVVVSSRSSMDNGMVAMADAMAVSNSVSNVGHMRHCGSAGQTKQSRDHEGLKR